MTNKARVMCDAQEHTDWLDLPGGDGAHANGEIDGAAAVRNGHGAWALWADVGQGKVYRMTTPLT